MPRPHGPPYPLEWVMGAELIAIDLKRALGSRPRQRSIQVQASPVLTIFMRLLLHVSKK
jgi:hypothetical protein